MSRSDGPPGAGAPHGDDALVDRAPRRATRPRHSQPTTRRAAVQAKVA